MKDLLTTLYSFLTATNYFFRGHSILWARAYRPASHSALPRWRNLGTMITPYYYYQPAPVAHDAKRRLPMSAR